MRRCFHRRKNRTIWWNWLISPGGMGDPDERRRLLKVLERETLKWAVLQ
jgi:hypothetical protein